MINNDFDRTFIYFKKKFRYSCMGNYQWRLESINLYHRIFFHHKYYIINFLFVLMCFDIQKIEIELGNFVES